ncbi:hypothetical protein [Conexibacter arvalis]|uniref:Putative cupredoxin-like copper-binding protein n=1 Tax=Conexibacter arvalis TaxID=912552 RepID=A0A840IG56_9ACTN|nr:hypothetical protein [Conexibacter arvalis]MBB4663183.1 putative cupredoxin-like copper-binding protein [Conexibacter arvalis]
MQQRTRRTPLVAACALAVAAAVAVRGAGAPGAPAAAATSGSVTAAPAPAARPLPPAPRPLAPAARPATAHFTAAATARRGKPRPKRSTAVGVGAREFRLSVYRPRVRVGEVRFNLTNYGEDAHDLVVRDRRGRIRGRTPEVRPGGRAVLSIRLGRGGYRLSCDVADHARRGMRATLKVVR